MTTLMWEAVAAPGRRDDLARWVLAALPGSEVYVSADDRVVAIAPGTAGSPPGPHSAPLPEPLPAPPPDLVARAPHAWPFEPFGTA